MIKRIVHIILGIGIPLLTLVVLGFTSGSNKNHPCEKVEVQVSDEASLQFIAPEGLKQMIGQYAGQLEGHPVGPGLLARIKSQIEANPFVESAAIYRTIEGNLHVKVSQRRPIVRVINTSNQSYYIDSEGKLMPFSEDYTARVMLASGLIHAGYSPATDLLADHAGQENMTASEWRLRGLYRLASYIDNDPFWRAMIDQIYVTGRGEFELVPVNGAHTIELGHADQLDEKFGKLMAFYRHGLAQVGWNYYRKINLKYHRQVVCSK